MKYKDAKNKGLVESLIPVHINIMRCSTHFWNWSSDIKDWIRGREIPENLKRAYKTPHNKHLKQ